MKSFFVELPVAEARKRWLQAARSAGESLLPRGREFVLEFIPAEGGCVIAMLPKPDLGNRRLPGLGWVAGRIRGRIKDEELEQVERLIRG